MIQTKTNNGKYLTPPNPAALSQGVWYCGISGLKRIPSQWNNSSLFQAP